MNEHRANEYWHPCGHCGQRDVGGFNAGYATIDTDNGPMYLCHPNAARPDCYRLVTVYHHATPCRSLDCRELAALAVRRDDDIAGVFLNNVDL